MRAIAVIVLVLLLAGCGGSDGARTRVEQRVRRQVEQRLMTQNPRQPGTRAATHVKEVSCARRGHRWACAVTLGDGSVEHVVVN